MSGFDKSKAGWTIRPTMELFVSGQDMDDIMSMALDYIGYWCDRAEVGELNYKGEYASEQISMGGTLKLYDEESEKVFTINLEMMLNGIKKWIEAGGDKYGAFQNGKLDCGRMDAAMADEIVQYAIFGEVIYA